MESECHRCTQSGETTLVSAQRNPCRKPSRDRPVPSHLRQELIETEATQLIGAAPYEPTESRVAERNGSRPRLLTTKAGDVELKIPKLRKGSFFPQAPTIADFMDFQMSAMPPDEHLTAWLGSSRDPVMVMGSSRSARTEPAVEYWPGWACAIPVKRHQSSSWAGAECGTGALTRSPADFAHAFVNATWTLEDHSGRSALDDGEDSNDSDEGRDRRVAARPVTARKSTPFSVKRRPMSMQLGPLSCRWFPTRPSARARVAVTVAISAWNPQTSVGDRRKPKFRGRVAVRRRVGRLVWVA